MFIEACGYGTFGDNCSRKCHCEQDTCNPVNGLCPSKCSAGWRGQTCSESKFSLLSIVTKSTTIVAQLFK